MTRANVIVPVEGPKVAMETLDFNGGDGTFIVDASQIVQKGQISYIQTLWVDNSDNPNPLTIVMNFTGQRVIIPAYVQQYVNILAPNMPVFNISSVAGDFRVDIGFINVPIQPTQWVNTPIPVGPTLRAILDFQNNYYSWNGVNKTFDDCFEFVPPSVSVVADVGLVIDIGGPSASGTVTASNDLLSALNLTVGCTAVIDITANAPDPNADGIEIMLGCYNNSPDYHTDRFVFTPPSIPYSQTSSFLQSTVGGKINFAATANGAHKFAGYFTSAEIGCCQDGNEVLTLQGSDTYNDSVAIFMFLTRLAAGNGVIRSVKYYDLTTDPAILQLLSS